ncbi:hypothetical protein NM688_g1251 [Phlebia brevispora]|uniref:Uncharacterized protein n=1 Tax=Phlebia brevispora TaxID=194682 RepID=A0ACC1TBR1_9APHY|nr:hypothetical protein NM688_g1251 [Phlebia brevispora]
MNAQGGLILLWLALCHLAGTYLFFRGFLLTHRRLSDPEPCNEAYCTLPAAYERIVLLVVDSLRFDFITPNPPEPAAIYHDVLKLPDPPTTTLQRIKGITAGSIPSFIDLGSTFGFTAGQSWLDGLRSAGKRIAFMGDDTWLSTFSSVFTPDMSWPYDSFNIEDFDTVDNGIMSHLLPLLRAETKSWDAIVAHFLGIDHVGHRVGPEHPAMRTKLAHMDSMLREIVALLDDQTLLVLLGDHGMDRRGNHGCDSVDEVTVGVWLYSKGRRLQHPAAAIPSFLRLNATYPGATASHRAIQQIDLAPSIALLLGLPIPPSNLGSVIPEIFWHDPTGATFDRALRLNTEQVHRYLAAQYAGFSGTEVEKGWPQLQDLRHRASARCSDAANHKCVASWASLFEYLNTALLLCRRSWPYFDPKLIIMGFLPLAFTRGRLGSVGDEATSACYARSRNRRDVGTGSFAILETSTSERRHTAFFLVHRISSRAASRHRLIVAFVSSQSSPAL